MRACSDVGFGFVASEVVPADGEGGTDEQRRVREAEAEVEVEVGAEESMAVTWRAGSDVDGKVWMQYGCSIQVGKVYIRVWTEMCCSCQDSQASALEMLWEPPVKIDTAFSTVWLA